MILHVIIIFNFPPSPEVLMIELELVFDVGGDEVMFLRNAFLSYTQPPG